MSHFVEKEKNINNRKMVYILVSSEPLHNMMQLSDHLKARIEEKIIGGWLMETKIVKGEITSSSMTSMLTRKGLLDIFIPKTTLSQNWKNWRATIDLKTCLD